jgi:hypothetical protein
MTGTAMMLTPARTLVLALFALAAALTLPPASASAARTSVPTVSNVAPLNLAIGDTLTITGRNFRAGRNRNTVVFKRDGQRAVFVTASEATATRIRLVVPTKLSQYLSRRSGGSARPTRFRLRILAARFGRAFTATKLSPVIGEAVPGSASPSTGVTIRDTNGQTVTVPVDTDPDCDLDGVRNSMDADDDNDFLSDALEVSLKLNTCSSDTDGDAIGDGWEYQSAVDLNNPGCNAPAYPTPCTPALPYPWKVPYPNPLDGGDAGSDFDGDWITDFDEFQGWVQHSGHDLSIGGMWYSGGLKSSQDPIADGCVGMPIPTARAPFTQDYADQLDANSNLCLSDGERDEDFDMLSNNQELTGELSANRWWLASFKTENPFTNVTWSGTKWLDGDTDGDGVYDGMDDQDHDDFWNAEEIERGSQDWDKAGVATGTHTGLWVQPFNPCLPNRDSRTCPDFVPADSAAWAPFPQPNGSLTYPRWPEWGAPYWPSGAPTHPLTRPL